jgi:hypothetical protein
MSEANELRGLPQGLATESRMALLEAALCAKKGARPLFLR